jgi:CubicO group peptidase (beta-lactamase class C family)
MVFVTLALALLLTGCAQPAVRPVSKAAGSVSVDWDQFEVELDQIRQTLKIPGFSAAVVRDQELVWAQGFGYADLENGVEATPDTPYRLASVTKPVAATLIMQLVEEGMLSLDDPVSQYGVELESEGVVTVWHLLTHTSEGVPGTRHNYDGNRYSRLGAVIEAASGLPFAELLSERILEPLGMTNTAPNYATCELHGRRTATETDEREGNWLRVNREQAKPYQLDPGYEVVPGARPSGTSPAAGLISSVVDLAKFDVALDQGLLLSKEAKAQMFKPLVSTHGSRDDLAYGLGWYSQQYKGTRLLWHSGRQPPSVSALYLKAPEQNATIIILANTAHLTTPFPLGQGDVLYSTLAHTFYKHLVFPQQFGRAVPVVDWESADLVEQLEQVRDDNLREVLARELWSRRQMYASVGQVAVASRLYQAYRQAYGPARPGELDLHAVHGVDYRPVAEAQVELGQAELSRFVGEYQLAELMVEAGMMPEELRIELSSGGLIGWTPDQACNGLVPVTATRFALTENPGLFVEFELAEGAVEGLSVDAGMIVAVYRPVE